MVVLDLIYNLSQLVALSVISGFIGQRWHRRRGEALLHGLIFGTAAVIGMLRPIVLGPGLIFDGRSVMISLCGLFFGPAAVSVAGGMAALCRILQGGVGALTGVLVITSSALLGVAFHLRWQRRGVYINSTRSWVFGLLVHVAMLLLMLTLPHTAAFAVLRKLGLPILLTYPLVTVLISKVIVDQAARRQTIQALQASEAKFRSYIDNSPDGVFIADERGRYLEVNPAASRITGYAEAELVRMSIPDLLTPDTFDIAQHHFHTAQTTGHASGESKFLHKNGMIRWWAVEAVKLSDTRFLGFTKDITDRKRAEARIQRLNRIYTVLSNVNQCIVRVRDLPTLLREACRIAVADGDFRMAWIGAVAQDAIQVTVMAHAGMSDGYLERLNIVLRDEPYGRGPTAVAIRTGAYVICNDIEHDPRMTPWRTAALQMDYHASAAFPIRVFGEVWGAYNVYAREADFFDAEEIKLMDELAGDLSFALEAIEQDKRRQQAEETLRRSELKYRTLVENVPQKIFYKDFNSVYISCNTRYAQDLGFASADEIAGKTDFDLYPRAFAEKYQADDRRIIRQGEVAEIQEELPVHGQIRFIATIKTPVRDEHGNITGILGIFSDITERKRADEELKETKAILQAAMDQSQAGIAIADAPDGTLRYVNRAGLLRPQTSAKELVEHVEANHYLARWHILHLDGTPFNADELPLIRAVRDGETSSQEFIIRRPDAEEQMVWANAAPILDETGQIKAAIMVFLDITDRKQAEAQIRQLNAELEYRVRQRTAELEAANQELQSFAYIVSHDLKAPLRGIAHLAEWLVQDYRGAFDVNGQEMIDLLIGRVNRLDKLIDGILEYSRIGRIGGAAQPIDLNELLREIIDTLAPPAHIQIVLATELPTMIGDATRMFQLFQNLLSNAIKFMDKPAGLITIDCADVGTHWRFRVTDNGPGIAPQHHTKIFQLFQTLHARDDRESTGVGLAIVKKIVERAGGTVTVTSAPDEGSAFVVTLPKTARTVG